MPQDEDRVFDVSKPHKVNPAPSGRPIIVGHHPQASDPMVNDRPIKHAEPDNVPEFKPNHVSIAVQDADKPASDELQPPQTAPAETPLMEHHQIDTHAPAVAPPPEASPAPPPPAPTHEPPAEIYPQNAQPQTGAEVPKPAEPNEAAKPAAPTAEAPASVVPPLPPVAVADPALNDLPLPSHHSSHNHSHSPHPQNHLAKPKKDSAKLLWLLATIVLLAGVYAALDATTSAMPFHIFKKSTATVTQTTTPPPSSPQSTSSSQASGLPSGFTSYTLAGTNLIFPYPTAWGAPAVTTEAGYSQRSTSAKSDGTYAYIVNFATNKDVQLAFTSAKYLPAARAATYYDFLQWCTGTNDAKIYKSLLHFTTASGVDTPSTISCDQGPLADATKLNTATILQPNTKNPDGSALGDLYTENLLTPTIPVVRAKDTAMTNGNLVKLLLANIKVNSAINSTNPSTSSQQ